MAISRGMDNKGVEHIYNEILLDCEKERKNDTCSNMDGPRLS